ncbi:YitT family protein [Clostridium sp. 'White wine YQ']|uniref:YitT family protein n=1 Tax=Clostridium sp. 'White wine YQ' TaxID=3027474 RepID=UPI002365189A|nr:YitT family protein [Clostridium sp. 'White wine YQ']MDD7795658.1 YitT family protein [Clostridium sp. 'White wine YQ']
MNKNILKDYFLITVGILLVVFSLEYFFIPNDIAAGGVTGIAIVLTKYVTWLKTGTVVFILNLILFAVAFLLIGGNFGAKTIYASFGLSFIMWAVERFLKPTALTTDLMLAAIFGTIVTSLGMAMIFNVNASTGGTDIVAKIINKYISIDIGKSLLSVDFLVTLAGAVTFGVNRGLYALLCVIFNGLAIDRVIEGFKSCKEVTIISDKNKEISQFIIKDLDRGCTFIQGKGGFSGNDTALLYTVLGRNEFIKLKNYIKEIDKAAFITVGEVHEVLGEGFGELQ